MTNTDLLPAPQLLELPAEQGTTYLETGDRATSGRVAWVRYELDRRVTIYRPLDTATFRVASVEIWANGSVVLWMVRQTRLHQDYKRNGWLNEDIAIVRGWTTLWPQQNADLAALADQARAVWVRTYGPADEALTSGNAELEDRNRAADEDVMAAELDDEVPAWERNLAQLATGPAADRIAELERALAEDDAIVEGLAAAAQRLQGEVDTAHGVIDRQAQRMATRTESYREARERITELEDERAPLRGAARDLAQAVLNRGPSAHEVIHLAQRIAYLVGDAAAPPAPMGDWSELLPAAMGLPVAAQDPRLALRAAGITVPLLLDGEQVPVKEYVTAPISGRRQARIIGVLVRTGDAYHLRVADGRGRRLGVPVAAVPAYVDGVRAAGFPSPSGRLEVRAGVLGMRERPSDAGDHGMGEFVQGVNDAVRASRERALDREHEERYDPSAR